MASDVGWTVFTQDFVGFGMEKERYGERKESNLAHRLLWVVKHPQAWIVVRAAGLRQAEEEERGGPAHMWLLHQSLFLSLQLLLSCPISPERPFSVLLNSLDLVV